MSDNPWCTKCAAAVELRLAEIDRLTRELAEAREALERQGDNMAFVINHAGLPTAWLEKFQRELEEDRLALKEKP